MSMRMRRKRNFDERLLSCADVLLARGTAGILNMKEAAERFSATVDFAKAFQNNLPVELEIGCGKGGFIIEMAKQRQDTNFLALEKMSNVILTPMERVKQEGISNVKFLNIRAECLPCYIPENSLDRIYLNFSTPLPKLGYASQRLTHRDFLYKYAKLLKQGGEIVQKTDDRDFFEFSLREYAAVGFQIKTAEYDLHKNGNPPGNVITEYEQKWVEQGKPIHFAIAVKND